MGGGGLFGLRKRPYLAERDAVGHAEVPQAVAAGFAPVHALVTTGAEFDFEVHGLLIFLLQGVLGINPVWRPVTDPGLTLIMGNNRER
jgi:hypothetical protein